MEISVEKYYNEFEYWYSAPNRKAHLPYVLKVLLQDETEDILSMIECQAGKSRKYKGINGVGRDREKSF